MKSNLTNDGFTIQSEIAQKVWNNFERELAHKLKPLSEEDAKDIRLEILSHLHDSAANDHSETEELRLINAIERLGDPDDYVTPLVADILLLQNTKKGYPLAVLQSFLTTARRGLIHTFAIMVLGFAYFFTVMIFLMAIMHIGDPDVGVWFYDTGDYALSFEAQPDAVQWLPKWFSPLAIVFSISCYWLLNRVLALLISKTKS
jgi:hypothetical protein